MSEKHLEALASLTNALARLEFQSRIPTEAGLGAVDDAGNLYVTFRKLQVVNGVVTALDDAVVYVLSPDFVLDVFDLNGWLLACAEDAIQNA